MQLAYELTDYAASRNKVVGDEFLRALGAHPHCPVHPAQRCFHNEVQQLKDAEEDEQRLQAMLEDAPKPAAKLPYAEERPVRKVVGVEQAHPDAE